MWWLVIMAVALIVGLSVVLARRGSSGLGSGDRAAVHGAHGLSGSGGDGGGGGGE